MKRERTTPASCRAWPEQEIKCVECSKQLPSLGETGFSLLELLVVMLLVGVLSSSAVSNLDVMRNPLADGSSELSGYMKLVRAKAIGSTQSYRIQALTGTQIQASFANSCDAASFSTDTRLSFELPKGVSFQTTSWSACFTSRGTASSNVDIVLEDREGKQETLEVLLGGAVRLQS